jgi:hypothetical protein
MNTSTAVSTARRARQTVPALSLALLLSVLGLIRFGGSPAPATAAVPPAAAAAVVEATKWQQLLGTEGYWRIGQDARGVWWFVSPEGDREFLNTVTTVQPYQLGRRQQGPHYVSRAWPHGLSRDDADDADLQRWAMETLARVEDAGFKALGAWCHPAFHELDVPITRDLNVWAYFHGAEAKFYHPDWKTRAEEIIRQQVEPLRENVNLVGYYPDNELDWAKPKFGPSSHFSHLPAGDPNRQQVIGVIRKLWPTVDDFNLDWRTDFANYAQVEALPALPDSSPPAYAELQDAWLYKLASDYFAFTADAVRRHDPNHLVLGVRFKGWAPPAVVRAMRGHVDAVSLNYYVGDAKLDEAFFRSLYDETGRPTIITEYSFHSLDGRSGNRNTFGFSAQVADQQARADGYKLMTERLASVPWIIGADWFQWNDEPPSGRTADGEDVNFGVVDVDDSAYDKLVAAVRETTPKLNALHAAGEIREDAWRERFDSKPWFEVPHLAAAPRIDGDLSDWPTVSQLPGIRRGHTLGLDRIGDPLPEVRLGWREDGLYVAVTVFDRDILGAPATAGWWTRDNAELWFRTRPVGSAQTSYTPHDHQFYFTPIAFPGPDGSSGMVSQWHRPGDAIDQTLAPHPAILETSRVLSDRYVVEMFLPAAALHGWAPHSYPELGFNFYNTDFQRAATHFWSAPKEVRTQHDPSTWGQLFLMPPR